MARIFCSTVLIAAYQGIGLSIPNRYPRKSVTFARDASSYLQSSSIPSLDAFRNQWIRFAEHYNRIGQVPTPTNVKVVLGVTTTKGNSEFRKVMRETWMKQPEVCLLSAGLNKSCSVYIAFVTAARMSKDSNMDPRFEKAQKDVGAYAENSNSYRTTLLGEELSLNITENNDRGKVYEFFKYASNEFSWATHIGKMDMDTYPVFYKLTQSLNDHRHDHCTDHYIGTPTLHTAGDKCGKEEQFSPYLEPEPCTRFMHGGLYILSKDLAKGMSEPGRYWDLHKVGHEDLLTSNAVKNYTKDKRSCLSFWRPQESYFHAVFNKFYS